jgi:hypothetical protein
VAKAERKRLREAKKEFLKEILELKKLGKDPLFSI